MTNDPDCRLFVSNLEYYVDKNILRKLFGKYGVVKDVYIPFDKSATNYKGLGYAFVEMSNPDEAAMCIASLNDTDGPKGRRLYVKLANKR